MANEHGTPADGPELKHGAIGFGSSLTIGLASVAPAYSLAAVLGLIVAEAGEQAPSVILVSFVPMLFVASAYYFMNRADPDCGTTFAWATRALGPTTGWLAGWAIVSAGIIVIGLLANTAATYAYLLVGWDAAAESKAAVVALSVVLMLAATYVTLRGIEISARTQVILITVQLAALILLATVALIRVLANDATPDSVDPAASWFSPFAIDGGQGALIAGVLLGVFIYWGWDSAVAVNEETEDSSHAPGRAAIVSTVILLGLYLLVTVSALAWMGAEKLGGFEDETAISELSKAVFASPLEKLAVLAVMTSALSSTQTTVLPSSRTLLSMARMRAIPAGLARIHPVFLTPDRATYLVGGLAVAFYVVFKVGSESFYESSLLTLGLLICINYGINALSCAVYYRRALSGPRELLLTAVVPLLGFAMFLYIFVRSIADFTAQGQDETYWLGVQSPLVIGAVLMVLGAGIMAMLRSRPGQLYFTRTPETASRPAAP